MYALCYRLQCLALFVSVLSGYYRISCATTPTAVRDAKQSVYIFCDTVSPHATIEKALYQHMVQSLPICCVDIFVYDPKNDTYLLVLRKDKPMQHEYWFPGGRLYKGESFFDCAIRKCTEEAGIAVRPLQVVGYASTIFGDSAWDTATHSVNIVVLAILMSEYRLLLDMHHADYRWVPIGEVPANVYLADMYHKAFGALNEML